MRRLLPDPADPVDPVACYAADERSPRAGGVWLLLNMLASADGATAVDGRSGGLGGPGDRLIFFALRAMADAILVGAGTVRAEDYGPPKISAADREARTARGQRPVPLLAVISQSLVFPPGARFLAAPDAGDDAWRSLVFTTATADESRRAELEGRADVVVAGDDRVDMAAVAAALAERDAPLVLCEGGPTLNGDLLAAGLVDELCLSIAPLIVGGRSRRAIEGPVLEATRGFGLARLLEEDGYLFLRYVAS